MDAQPYLIQRPPDVDGTVLDDRVDHLGDGRGEVGIAELGVEENFGPKETFVPHVH